MKRIFFCMLFLGAANASTAQLRLKIDRRDDKSVDISVEGKDRPGMLTVFLTLSNLSNCNMDGGRHKYLIRHDNERVVSLRPMDAGNHIGLNTST